MLLWGQKEAKRGFQSMVVVLFKLRLPNHTAWGVGAAARVAALLKTPPVGVEMAPLGRCC